jgi:DNA-binding beta-propeller fold protein YncE
MAADGLYTVAGNGQAAFADAGTATYGSLNQPSGLAVDHQGNLLIADTGNHRLRFLPVNSGNYFLQSMAGAGLYTLAGNGMMGNSGDNGPAQGSMLHQPSGVAVDRNGNAYVTSRGENRVVMVMRTHPPIAVLK